MNWLYLFNDEIKKCSDLINAMSALSTLAAVVISLRLAKNSYSPKLEARVYTGNMLYADEFGEYTETSEKNILLSIQNRGPVPVTLNMNSFNWKFWRHEVAMMQVPLNPVLNNASLIIPPAEGKLIVLTNRLEELRRGMLDQNLLFLAPRIRLEIHGSDGVIHRAKLSQDLRKYLAKNK